MSATAPFPLVAVDVGNSRVKLARFDEAPNVATGAALPSPAAVVALPSTAAPDVPLDGDALSAIVGDRPADAFAWHLGSVQRAVAALSATLWHSVRPLSVTKSTLPPGTPPRLLPAMLACSVNGWFALKVRLQSLARLVVVGKASTCWASANETEAPVSPSPL